MKIINVKYLTVPLLQTLNQLIDNGKLKVTVKLDQKQQCKCKNYQHFLSEILRSRIFG